MGFLRLVHYITSHSILWSPDLKYQVLHVRWKVVLGSASDWDSLPVLSHSRALGLPVPGPRTSDFPFFWLTLPLPRLILQQAVLYSLFLDLKAFNLEFLVAQQVKDPALALQWPGFLLWLRNIHMLWVWPKKLKNKRTGARQQRPLKHAGSYLSAHWARYRLLP